MSDTHMPGNNPNTSPAGGAGDPFGDDAMRLFAAMQQRIEAIKSREAAAAQRESDLAARLHALELRATELTALDARLSSRDADAARRQSDLDRTQSELIARAERLRETEAALSSREASVASEIARLSENAQAREQELQAREKALAEQRDAQRAVMGSLESRSAELERIAAQLAARETRASETEASYQMAREAALREAEESRAASAKLASELQARAMLLAQVKSDLESRQTALQGQWTEVEARIAQLARFKQELDARDSQSAARDAEMRAALEDAERRRAAAAESEARAAQAQASARRAQDDAERSIAAASAELRTAQAELARVTALASEASRCAQDLAEQRTMLEISATEATERARLAESRIAEIESELAALRSRPPEVRIETRTERVVERVGPTEEEVAALVAAAVAQARTETTDQVASMWGERLRLAQDAVADAESRAQRFEATAAEANVRLAGARDEAKRTAETYEQRTAQMASKLFDVESRLAEMTDARDSAAAQLEAQVRDLEGRLESLQASSAREVSQARAEAERRAEAAGSELRIAQSSLAELTAQLAQSQASARETAQALEALRNQPPVVKVEPDPAALGRIAELEAELARSQTSAAEMQAEIARIRAISEKLGLEARRIKLEATQTADHQAAELAALRAELAARPPAALALEAEELRRALHDAREQLAASTRERHDIEARAEMLTRSVRQAAEADRAALCSQVEALQSQLKTLADQHTTTISSLTQRAEQAESEHQRLASAVASTEAEARSQVQSTEASLQAARHQIADLTARLATPTIDPALMADRDALAGRVQKLEAELASEREALGRTIATLQERLGTSQSEAIAAQERQTTALTRLEAELTARQSAAQQHETANRALQDRVASLESQLAQAGQQLASAAASADAQDEVSRLRETLNERESSLRNLAGRLAEMEIQLSTQGTQPVAGTPQVPAGTGLSEARRHRLARYRAALRERTAKIETAYNAIRQKESMLDRVVEQRVNSALAAAALLPKPVADPAPVSVVTQPTPLTPPTTPGLISASEQKARTFPFALTGVAAAVVAAVLWLPAYWTIKPLMGFTYAATAVIKADTGGLAPTQSEMALWNSRNTKLLESMQIYDQAAKKFGQQRVDHLASVDFVKRYFVSRLTVGGAVPGELTLRLRGDSPSEAENALRTFVETVVSTANATRILQGNEYSTVLDARPKADPDPLTGSKLWTGVWAAAVSLLIGATFWLVCHRFRKSAQEGEIVDVNPDLPTGFLREPASARSGWVPSGATVAASVASIKGLGKHLTKGVSGGKKAA